MTAEELFKAGQLTEAIAAQTDAVKHHPGDHGARLFLFELLVFAGDLKRAKKQLDVFSYDEPELEEARLTYLQLVEAEQARRKLFESGVEPKFFEDPPDHVRLRLEAIAKLREQNPAAAMELLAQAEPVTPMVACQLNEVSHEIIRDADDVFGTVLEVLARGHYYWLPLEQTVSLSFKAPRFPRDLYWRPAQIETTVAVGEGFLSALYPGTYQSADDELRLGRKTDWVGGDAAPVTGLGGRTFLAGEDAVGLVEWRDFARGELTMPEA